MTEQDESFFRKVTLQVCSSLDIETAMQRTFPCLAASMPLEEMRLDVFDQHLGAIRRIAHVSTEGIEPAGAIFPLPEALWDWWQDQRGPVIVSSEHAILPPAMGKIMDVEGYSEIIVPLRIEEKLFGTLVLRAKGEGWYTPDHAQLLASVSDPFAIALWNALAHQELLRHKDELLDDKHFLSREMAHTTTKDIIGGHGGLRHVVEMVRQVAPLSNTVLIMGETGVGKEVIASAIHYASPRREGPFIKVNCGAIPESLIDSELFGYEKGAFTGATNSNRGRFERAEGGTLFLDEIGELSPQAQVRLLRVLQAREIERVGGTRTIKVDVRVIAATHRNLEQMVSEHRFREDLWYRINVFPIIVPPLRQRKEDIPALVRHFVTVKGRELGMAEPPSIAPGALVRLGDYDWLGNVRELENLVERELIRHPKGPLLFDTLLPAPSRPGILDTSLQGSMNLDEATARHIAAVLRHTGGKIHGPGGAAELLGINASTLRNRMQKLGIPYGRKSTPPGD
ncbi:sigma 54-interacting transcriptional regulator [Holophaga foetida]|uniref:sigma 54-interacting transcriptional regulator n=1 Tax=Holophaga foetida TaxID=35839 RepID=UPI0002473F52|nr:sigma 54-interacting transcriptional regulator [Holophaga foetida]